MPVRMLRICQAAAIAVIVPTFSLAQATEISARFFGYRLEMPRDEDGRTLRIDGVKLLKNWYLDIEEVAVVAGVPVIIGSSSNGGNACESSPFVVSFPKEGKPRLDGPLDTCSGTGHQLTANGIDFFSAAIPGREGERWQWTFVNAFTKLPKRMGATARAHCWSPKRSSRLWGDCHPDLPVAGTGQTERAAYPDRGRFGFVRRRLVHRPSLPSALLRRRGGNSCRLPREAGDLSGLEAGK